MNVSPRRTLFYRRPRSDLYRMFLWVCLILGGIWLIRQVRVGEIEPLFMPTPTPTRTAASYAMEGEAHFIAGKLDAAILAYQEAVRVDPTNAQIWAKLARIQIYSSALLTNPTEQLARLEEGLASANRAVELAPGDSTVLAIRSFALDWNANPALVGTQQAGRLLIQAEQDAVRALTLDNQNTLALAYYAEILLDQQKWVQAEQNIRQAAARGEDLMDVHRVYAAVLEATGQYNQAIQEYDRAIALAPNLTFLYLRCGANYRVLAFKSVNPTQARELYERSLEYFAQAVKINDQLQIKDPAPYVSIARTYSQMGEYFIAARNIQKAIEFKPADPDLYGQLGVIYYKSRNYEGSIPALKCAVRGCTAEESCDGRGGCGPNDVPAEVIGLPLSPLTADYYLIYGTALVLLSRPEQNNCPEALDILGQLKAQFSGDPIILSNVRANELMCASLGVTAP